MQNFNSWIALTNAEQWQVLSQTTALFLSLATYCMYTIVTVGSDNESEATASQVIVVKITSQVNTWHVCMMPSAMWAA